MNRWLRAIVILTKFAHLIPWNEVVNDQIREKLAMLFDAKMALREAEHRIAEDTIFIEAQKKWIDLLENEIDRLEIEVQ